MIYTSCFSATTTELNNNFIIYDSEYFPRVFTAQKGIEPAKYRNAYFDIHIKAMQSLSAQYFFTIHYYSLPFKTLLGRIS